MANTTSALRPALTLALTLVTLAASAVGAGTTARAAVPGRDGSAHGTAEGQRDGHVIDGPFSARQRLQRQAALEQVLSGRAEVERRGGSRVVNLGERKYVELGRERTAGNPVFDDHKGVYWYAQSRHGSVRTRDTTPGSRSPRSRRTVRPSR
ncbi:hypothetical protein QWM81_06435 [Streptomyces ficellus]|uniref:Secreted protein n=1 Tax=Streptomyces ficellus TaxID=1977088 RepID=A0ABT7Z2K6_9ACTN|nr:hypothetical protein [Streptomyces ficellus]MDN3293686.1 hypothetical protein [Streptomyces ficellus]